MSCALQASRKTLVLVTGTAKFNSHSGVGQFFNLLQRGDTFSITCRHGTGVLQSVYESLGTCSAVPLLTIDSTAAN